MKFYSIKLLGLYLVGIIMYCSKITAQELRIPTDKFVIGAYMHHSPWGFKDSSTYHQHDSILFSLWRPLSIGINTAMVYTQLPNADNGIYYVGPYQSLTSNMDSLKVYPNVIAMNQYSAHVLLLDVPPEKPNVTIRSFDWIFFYSGAYYSKWDATQENIYIGDVGLRHTFGGLVNVEGKNYWSTHGDGYPDVNDSVFIYGPNYSQETRYRGSRYPTVWDNAVQTYKVKFNLKLRIPVLPENANTEICEIRVETRYKINETNTIDSEIVAYRTLTAGEIQNNINNILSYDYSDYCQNSFKLVGEKPEELEADQCQKILIDVQFKVKYFHTGYELLISDIEVYDVDIWEKYLFDEFSQEQARQNIINYLDKFRAENPEFYNSHLKYFLGVDEPHSIDCYIPHAFVRETLSSKPNAPQIFSHFYPEWNGKRDNNGKVDVIPRYINTVKPIPYHFYYGPFSPYLFTERSLESLRYIIDATYPWYRRDLTVGNNIKIMKDFYITLMVWDEPNGNPNPQRGPTPSELRAAVMLSVSHGAKGIFFEPFYSYNNIGGLWEPITTRLDTPKPTAIMLRDNVIPRLNSVLGQKLLKLKYTGNEYNGNELCLRYELRDNVYCYSWLGNSNDFLSLHLDYLIPNEMIDFNAAILVDSTKLYNKYFMVTNLITANGNSLHATVSNPSQEYLNYRLRNIEGGMDVSFSNSLELDDYFEPGDGKLFELGPVVINGGNILENETINSNITLTEPMTITANKTLTVNSTYTVKKDITLQNGASIVVNTGKKMVIVDTAMIKVNTWNQGLVGTIRIPNSNPRIFWGQKDDAVNYKVMRKVGEFGWEEIASIASNANIFNYEYTDYTKNVTYQGINPIYSYLRYKVIAEVPNGRETNYHSTNEVSYTVERLEKEGQEGIITEYKLEQCYPNPFNPTTTIAYQYLMLVKLN